MNMHTTWTAEAGQQVRLALRQARSAHPFYRRHQPFFRFIDSHQKWLLLHLLSENSGHDEDAPIPRKGVAANWIAERAEKLGIASRNTTLAFLGQLTAYGYLQRQACRADGRIRLLAPSEQMRVILSDWAACLADVLALARPAGSLAMTSVHADIAGKLIEIPTYRTPAADVRLVQSTRGGWLLMSDIIGRIDPEECEMRQVPVRDFSVAQCARQHGLSKSTIYRLLREAADTGAVGWTRHCGEPVLWLSRDHLVRYAAWNGLLLETVRVAIEGGASRSSAANLVAFATRARDHAGISAPATSLL